MKRPQLGDWCIVSGRATLYRVTSDGSQPRYGSKDMQKDYPLETRWQGVNCLPFRAMFVGWRSMSIGTTRMEYDGDDNGKVWRYPVFKRTGTVEVWMFVESARQNMVYALPGQVQFEAQSE